MADDSCGDVRVKSETKGKEIGREGRGSYSESIN